MILKDELEGFKMLAVSISDGIYDSWELIFNLFLPSLQTVKASR